MIKFGFDIKEGRQIDVDKANRSFFESILDNEPSLKLCIGCGGCTATCSSGEFTAFNFRRVHHLLRWGENRDIAGEIAKCMFCGLCKLVCPRGVNTRNVIFSIRKNLASTAV